MKTNSPRQRAFTLVELIVVVAVIGLLATLIVRAQFDAESQARADRIRCVNNIKQIGLSFRMWSNDHNDKFPMQTPAAKEGSLESIDKQEPWRHYQAISNELVHAKVLVCPSDDRKAATNFARLTLTNLSYFVGLDADEAKPQTILSGDRNITNALPPIEGVLELPDAPPAGWTASLHNEAGNLGLGDGSAQQVNSIQLRRQVIAANAMLKTNKTRLHLPLGATKP